MKMLFFRDEQVIGESVAFFKGDKLITVIHGNDGDYRSEYMDCLFEAFGVEVVQLKKLNAKQKKQIPSNYLTEEL